MHPLRLLFCLILSTFFASCSFNGVFLHPDPIPSETKQASSNDGVDTTVIFFNGDTHQPVFVKNGKDTLEFDYTIESVLFNSTSGNKLHGWFIKPKDVKPDITILAFHGNAGSILSQYTLMLPLVKKGFQVFIFDYSGFGFSEGKATRKNVLLDGNSALDYIKTRTEIQSTKLVIYGQSLGGHLSGVVASERQAEIDGLVIEGAFSSHDDIAAYSAGFFGRLMVREMYSAKKSIQSFHKPVLIIHSMEDSVVPFELGKIIYENANEPKSFYEIKGRHVYGPKLYADSIAFKINQMLLSK